MKPNSTKIMKQQTKQQSEERYDVVHTIEFNESRSNKHSGKTKLFKGKFLNEIQRELYHANRHETQLKFTEAQQKALAEERLKMY